MQPSAVLSRHILVGLRGSKSYIPVLYFFSSTVRRSIESLSTSSFLSLSKVIKKCLQWLSSLELILLRGKGLMPVLMAVTNAVLIACRCQSGRKMGVL